MPSFGRPIIRKRSRFFQWTLDIDKKYRRELEVFSFALCVATIVYSIYQWFK